MNIRIFGASMILAVYALLVTKYLYNGRVLGCYFLPVNVSMCGVLNCLKSPKAKYSA